MRLSITIPIDATPEAIWPFLADFAQRRLWETDLEALDYDGPIANGTTGTMKLAGMPAMKFELVGTVPGQAIADKVATPDGAALTFTHTITAERGSTWLTQEVRLDKPTPDSDDFGFLCAVFADTPQAAWRLKGLVES